MHNLLENCFNEERFQNHQHNMFLRQSTISLTQSTTTIYHPESHPSGKLNTYPSVSTTSLGSLRENEHTMFIR